MEGPDLKGSGTLLAVVAECAWKKSQQIVEERGEEVAEDGFVVPGKMLRVSYDLGRLPNA